MSGRDHEPISAFFPSLDRNLILDLDRQLRGAPVPVVPEGPANMDLAPLERNGPRPNVTQVVEAVEQAGHSLSSMAGRIDDLESHIANLEAGNSRLSEKLSASQHHVVDLEDQLKIEMERAARIEAVAAQQASRAVALDRELTTAYGDLARITDAIAATLGFYQKNRGAD